MTEDELRDLAERTQQVVEMSQTIGWDLFFDRAKAEIESHQRAIMAGNLTAEDYRKESGWIQGAAAVLGLPGRVREEFQRVRAQYEEEKKQMEAEEIEGVRV